MESKTYQLRKAILAALAEYSPTACSAEEITGYPRFMLLKPSDKELAEQWKQLKSFGYIEESGGFGGAYCKITEKGLRQVNPEFPTDPFISGRPN